MCHVLQHRQDVLVVRRVERRFWCESRAGCRRQAWHQLSAHLRQHVCFRRIGSGFQRNAECGSPSLIVQNAFSACSNRRVALPGQVVIEAAEVAPDPAQMLFNLVQDAIGALADVGLTAVVRDLERQEDRRTADHGTGRGARNRAGLRVEQFSIAFDGHFNIDTLPGNQCRTTAIHDMTHSVMAHIDLDFPAPRPTRRRASIQGLSAHTSRQGT